MTESLRRWGSAGLVLAAAALLSGCGDSPLNSPYAEEELRSNAMFVSYGAPVAHLDPLMSYSGNDTPIVNNIVEAPFNYSYLTRPYTLTPQIAEEIPKPVYLDSEGNVLPENAPRERIDRVEYTIKIRKGIKYAPHPCFDRDADGNLKHHNLTDEDVEDIETPLDFEYGLDATQELKARDYVLEFRRQLDPKMLAPMKKVLEKRIVGARELAKVYKDQNEEARARRKREGGFGYAPDADERINPIVLDYMAPEFEGCQLIDDYTYKVVLKAPYPQILYWMAMTFMGPVPQEALDFYNQSALLKKEINMDRWPVGTGAYYLSKFERQRRVQLKVNPHYRKRPGWEKYDAYPSIGMPGDREAGLLADAGKPLPFIDTINMIMEREAIPLWNKFQQGYYDTPVLSTAVDSNTINMATKGSYDLSPDLRKKGIRMAETVGAGLGRYGFNMHDPVVGGLSEKQCKLRRAISIALDYEEYIQIFEAGRAIPAMGPIPPGIFGAKSGKEGMNPYTHYWDEEQQKAVRKPIEEARRLLAEAGYPGGKDEDGRSLAIHLSHYKGPEANSELEWFRQRFELLGIELKQIRTDASQFWNKWLVGNWQTAFFGWGADYPDPESFFFLWSKPSEDLADEGIERPTYDREEFHELYPAMESMENSPERQLVIDQMVELLRHDAPDVFTLHAKSYGLQHEWLKNSKHNPMVRGSMKYKKIDPELRWRRIREWNQPVWWPVAIFFGLVLFGSIPAITNHHRRQVR